MVWVQRTGAVSWEIRFFFISSGSETAFAVTFWYTGQTGAEKGVERMAVSSSTLAGSISGEWKAPPTGNTSARLAPAAFSFSQAMFTPLIVPEITSCPGQL